MTGRKSGVTLLEMLIVMAIVALIVAISYPSVASGLETIRLRSAADSVVSFLNSALTHAERREQPVELVINPRERLLTMLSTEPGFERKLVLPEGISIVGDEPRQFLFMPGGTPPRVGIDLVNAKGVHKVVEIDPITGVPQD